MLAEINLWPWKINRLCSRDKTKITDKDSGVKFIMEYPCNSDLEAKIKQEELIETQNLEGTSLSTRGRIQKEESKYSKCLEESALGSKGTGRANAGDIAIGIATGESRVMETISGIISSADFASNSYDQESDKNMIRLSVHTGQPSTSSGVSLFFFITHY